MLNTLIPISLVITLDLIKIIQAIFIYFDAELFSLERGRGCQVSTTTINEELGQVTHIFSDKTGTLTRNVMEFKLFTAGQELYGDPDALNDSTFVKRTVLKTDEKSGLEYSFSCPKLRSLLMGDKGQKLNMKVRSTRGFANITFDSQRALVQEFLTLLSTAHECVPELTRINGKTNYIYQGPSPDEITLVDFAA